MIYVTDETFEADILGSDKPVLVDLYADWCGPCKMLGPVIEEIAAENTNIKVCKVNVDENPKIASALGVMSIPALFVFKSGEVVSKGVGFQPKASIMELINKAL